jgi:hypothetical protein
LPEDRDWTNSRDKCDQCIRGGQACGPNVLKPDERKSANNSGYDSSLAANVARPGSFFLATDTALLDARCTVDAAPSGSAQNGFSSPNHNATSEAEILSLGTPGYPPYELHDEQTMALDQESARFVHDFPFDVGAFDPMYSNELGSGSSDSTRADIRLQAQMTLRYCTSAS